MERRDTGRRPTTDPGAGPSGEDPGDVDRVHAPRLHEALSDLRLRRPSLTNRTVARRAQSLAPARAPWHVDDRRLSEWFRGVSVPHHVEALLAVVTVLLEDGSCAGGDAVPGAVRRLTAAERARWTRLWHRERGLRRAVQGVVADPVAVAVADAQPAAQPPEPAGSAGGALLAVPVTTPDRLRLLDELADAVREDAVRRAGAATLLVPAPLPLTWRADTGAVNGPLHGMFDRLPGTGHAPTAPTTGGRAELFDLYAAAGHGRVVVVGDVGAGKTSSGLLLALDALAHRATQPSDRRVQVPVPVVVDVAGWDVDAVSPVAWLLREIAGLDAELAAPAVQAQLRRAVERGHVSLVVDGLDELPEEMRRAAVRALVRRVGNRVVLLARPQTADAVADLLDGCTVVRLEELAGPDVHAYLRGALRSTATDAAAPRARPRAHGPAHLPDFLRRPAGVVLLREGASDDWSDGADAPVHGAPAHQVWAGQLLRQVTGSFPHPRQRAAVAGGLRDVACGAVAGGARGRVDWRRITAAVGGRPLALTAGTLVALTVALLHGAEFFLHRRHGFRGVLLTANCLEITDLGRAVHELALLIAWSLVLGAATTFAVHLRTTDLCASPPIAGALASRRRRPSPVARGAGHLAFAAAAGAAVNAAVWLVTAGAFQIAGLYVPTAACAVFPSRSAPATELLLAAAGRGAVVATILAVPVVLALVGRGRGALHDGVPRPQVKMGAALTACAVASSLICMTVMRRAGDGDIRLPFTPRPDVEAGTQRMVQLVDGLVAGLDVGLSAALALAVLGAVLMAPGRHRPTSWFPWARAWPAGPEPAGLVALLLVGAVVAEWFLLGLLLDGRRPSALWLLAMAPLALVVRRAPRIRERSTPASALADDRRFARTVTGTVLFAMLPMQLEALRAADLLHAPWNPPGSEHTAWRVLSCMATVCLVAALGAAWTVTDRPLVLLCDAYLSCVWRCRVRLVAAVEQAHRHGLLWTVGREFRFRHPDYAAHLAAGAWDSRPTELPADHAARGVR